MPPPLGLVNLSVGDLVAAAGGDPWKINDELQAGDPGAINAQADAFHAAAGSATEVEDDFQSAKQRFEKGWKHNGAEHPINESAQVTQATTTMHMQKSQLGKTALDLENVAAALATAQLNASAVIAGLDNQLHAIDDAMGTAKANNQDTTALHDQAVAAVKSTLEQVKGDQSAYSSVMAAAKSSMSTSTGEAPSTSETAENSGEGSGLVPTPGDLALGGAGAVTGATTDGVRGAAVDAMKAGPKTGPGAADAGLLRWLEDSKVSGFSRVGGVTAAAAAIPAVLSDIHDGDSVAKAVTRETVGTAAGIWAGAEAGAAIGTFIPIPIPGVGTGVGLVVGAAVGALVATEGSKVVGKVWDAASAPLEHAVSSLAHGVESIFGFG